MSLFSPTSAGTTETRFSVAWSEFAQSRTAVAALGVVTVLIFVVINLTVDLLYAAIDPRVRLSDAKG